jgi:gag-pre-integrase-like protein/integrase-like protein
MSVLCFCLNNTSCVTAALSCTNKTSIDLAKLWHLRLGHIPFSQLKILLPNFNVNKFNASKFCTICPAAKQTRCPFSLSSIKTTRHFQMIHVDVWGPYRHCTHDDCKFFLTIVDDFTRCTWLYLMRCKSQYSTFIQQFHAYVTTQFNAPIQIIRSDNAKEICDGASKAFYLRHGIIHQT